MNSQQRRRIRRIQKKSRLAQLMACRLKGHRIVKIPIMNIDPNVTSYRYVCDTCYVNSSQGIFDSIHAYGAVIKIYSKIMSEDDKIK